MQGFEKIYAEYSTLVYKFALSLCQNPSLAEEIAQETFFKALCKIESFRGQCKISTWLCQIAKNCYYEQLRRERKKGDGEACERPSSESLEGDLLDHEAAYDIHKALHRLREPYKEVFWLKTFGELSYEQISELFEKSESWARVTYFRAKLMIKEEMQ